MTIWNSLGVSAKLAMSLCFLAMSIFPAEVLGQEVRGTVTEAQTGDPIPGVNVVIEGTTTGTTTNIEGDYQLSLPSDDVTLVFSFLGYIRQEIPVEGRSEIDVALEESIRELDDLIVVGYGTVRRTDLTGAVTEVNAEDFERVPALNPLVSLQGRAPGLQITQNSGEPGASARVRVRGEQSISGSNAPVFVVDGVITTNIDNLNSRDIESVTVLKDASAAAIYGSRAANGVIQITTKRGNQSSAPEISLHAYGGIQHFSNLEVELLDADEWLMINQEAWENAGITPTWDEGDIAQYEGVDTDWLNAITRPGYLMNTNLSVSGGTEMSNYYVSAGYADNTGMVEAMDYSRYNLRLNTDHQINDWIAFGNSLNLFSSNRNANSSPYGTALMKVPLTRMYEDDGDWGRIRNIALEHQYGNPVWRAQNTVQEQTERGVVGNLYLTLSLLDGLDFTTRGNVEWTSDYRTNFAPGAQPQWNWEDSEINSLSKDNRETLHWIVDLLMNYERSFSDDQHHVSGLLGSSIEEQTFERLWGTGVGTPNNEIRYLSAADPTSVRSNNTFSDWAFSSMFGRIGYTYLDRYVVSGTIRRDGTSRLHEDQRWGIFPSLSAAWRIGEESFMDGTDWLNELRLRTSWGRVGNVLSIGAYGTTTSLTNWNYARNEQIAQGYTLASAVNTDLKWESTLKRNIGLDVELLDHRLYGMGEFFVEDTYDLLFAQPIPNSTGLVGNPFINAGQIRNTGVELSLGYRQRAGDWHYDVNVNLTHLRNEVIDLEGRDLRTSGIVEGEPLRSYFGYRSNGIIRTQEDLDNHPHLSGKGIGDIWLLDLNEDGVVDADDRTIIGHNYPDLSYGAMGMVGFKNFTLQVQLQGLQGVQRDLRVSGNLGTLHYWTQFAKNHDRLILDRFHPERNPEGNMPQVSLDDTGNNLNLMSDFWLRDASYLRISNVNLNYDVPASLGERVGLRNLGIYASVQNLYTLTNFDVPEVDTTSDPLAGVPQPRTWTLGLNVGF